jgi:non-heme chloroperoxidase
VELVEVNDGARLAYEDRGMGHPVLLVPGWSMSRHWWDRQVDVLAESYRVIALDPRSQGDSPNVSFGNRLSRHGRDIYDVIEALELVNPFIIAWSMGCSSVMSYWSQCAPKDIRGLVLNCFNPSLLPRDDWAWGFDGDGASFIRSIGENHAQVVEDLMPTFFHRDRPEPWMVPSTLQTPAYAAEEVLWEQFHSDWRDVFPRIDVPVLFVAGQHDGQVPWQALQWAAKSTPGGRFRKFANSSHVPFWEEADEYNQVLIEFLSEVSASSSSGSNAE